VYEQHPVFSATHQKIRMVRPEVTLQDGDGSLVHTRRLVPLASLLKERRQIVQCRSELRVVRPIAPFFDRQRTSVELFGFLNGSAAMADGLSPRVRQRFTSISP
jgi:hypothetical protein